MSAALVESVRLACYNGPARVVLPDHESRSTESRTALASRSDEACDSRGAAFLFAECEVRMTPDQEARFWAKVVADPGSGCWHWGGTLCYKGYGMFYPGQRRRPMRAHRILWEHERGAIPAGLQLDHLCRNRACVNPAHLEPVTNKENVLRGEAFSAKNARKTHCPKGHEYTEANTVYASRKVAGGPKYRMCRACKKATGAAKQAMKLERKRALNAEAAR